MGVNFSGLKTMDIFVDTRFHGFLILQRKMLPFKYFVWILNSWIDLPTKYTKVNIKNPE